MMNEASKLVVKIAGLGTIFWEKPGETVREQAVKNTTGFKRGRKDQLLYINEKTTNGMVRINCNSEGRIGRYADLIGTVYVSAGVERYGTKNRLLLHPRLLHYADIDAYLVCLNSAKHGNLDFKTLVSPFIGNVQLISASEKKGTQEVLLLMWSGSEVKTSLGRLGLSWILCNQN